MIRHPAVSKRALGLSRNTTAFTTWSEPSLCHCESLVMPQRIDVLPIMVLALVGD